MAIRRWAAGLGLIALLAGCGGGGGNGGGLAAAPPGATPTPTPPQTGTGCSVRDRQLWAQQQLREWYLFPETLPASLDPTPYATVQAYIDALTATARAQGRDRFFTYLTSIKEEDAFFNAGASAGFGMRVSTDATERRVLIAESFEGTPALAAGIDRGSEILAIGTTAADLRSVGDIIAAEGAQGVTDALGPSTAGVTRLLRVRDSTGTHDLLVTKAQYELTPVSARYGAKILDDGGRRVGYLNLRTFINTAESPLRSAFDSFRAAGVTELIVDLRYNGGGLVSVAELIGDLMGRNRFSSDVFSYTVFRPEKSGENETRTFNPKPQSITPMRVAFIGTGGTASASELVINAFIPYFGDREALIGANTYGKPVGQIALDRSACDDRLRVIAFATQNAARQGGYFNGLAGTVPASCQAGDDLTHAFGDPQEASVRTALDFLAGRQCTPIPTGQQAQALRPERTLLTPERPTAAQHEVPGLF